MNKKGYALFARARVMSGVVVYTLFAAIAGCGGASGGGSDNGSGSVSGGSAGSSGSTAQFSEGSAGKLRWPGINPDRRMSCESSSDPLIGCFVASDCHADSASTSVLHVLQFGANGLITPFMYLFTESADCSGKYVSATTFKFDYQKAGSVTTSSGTTGTALNVSTRFTAFSVTYYSSYAISGRNVCLPVDDYSYEKGYFPTAETVGGRASDINYEGCLLPLR
jgi:hypothetical protein